MDFILVTGIFGLSKLATTKITGLSLVYAL
jgi:hypothetical protein